MTDIYQLLTDYYDLMLPETKEMFRGVWDGNKIIVENLYMETYGRVAAHFIQYILPYNVKRWMPVRTYSATKAYDTFQDIISIPKLQDKYYNPTATYVEGTDYTIVDGAVHFNGGSHDGETLWAETLYFKNPYLDTLWGYGGYSCYGEDRAEVARLVEWGIKYGPKKKVMEWVLNGLAGYPFAYVEGEVDSITDKGIYYDVVINDRTHRVNKSLIGTGTMVTVGQDVERFEPLITGKVTVSETFGYTYGTAVSYGEYKTSTTVEVVSGSETYNVNDYVEMQDVWRGKVEYGVVKSYDSGTKTVEFKDTFYLEHDADADIVLRKVNPISGSTRVSVQILSHVGLSDTMKDNIDNYYKSIQNPAIRWDDPVYA